MLEIFIKGILLFIALGIFVMICQIGRELYLKLINKITNKIENIFKRKK